MRGGNNNRKDNRNMFMDYELNVRVNELIAELVNDAKTNYGVNIDMVVTQDNKYRNTEFEVITIGLGCSKGLPSNLYYFNAVKQDGNKGIDEYYNEPVSYYEHYGKRCMMYRLEISPLMRVVTVFEVGYGKTDSDIIYHNLEEKLIELGASKFSKKVEVYD